MTPCIFKTQAHTHLAHLAAAQTNRATQSSQKSQISTRTLMTKQEDLIGPHPPHPNQFNSWLNPTDHPHSNTKCHRELNEKIPVTDANLLDWLARKLIYHHYTEDRIAKLKLKYGQLGFPKYAEQHRKLPRADRTMKGNATEIILIEYIEGSQHKALIKAFKLRYNPNVDQAIKGDDTLLVDIYNDGKKDRVKLFLGESKFRQKPTKAAVDEISDSLKTTKNPLSYSFLIEELYRDATTTAT